MTDEELRDELIEVLWKVQVSHHCRMKSNAAIDFKQDIDAILSAVREAGYVRLAENQELPENLYSDTESLDPKWVCEATQQDMLKVNFKKVVC